MPPELLQLAELCLAHLSREEAALQAARAGLTELTDALVKGDLARLQTAVRAAGPLADETHRTRDARGIVCATLAEALDLSPESVTLSLVAIRLPAPYAGRVAAARDRLQVLAAEVERLSRRAASVVGYCRGFLQRVVADESDSGAATAHYGPGPRREVARGALLVARG